MRPFRFFLSPHPLPLWISFPLQTLLHSKHSQGHTCGRAGELLSVGGRDWGSSGYKFKRLQSIPPQQTRRENGRRGGLLGSQVTHCAAPQSLPYPQHGLPHSARATSICPEEKAWQWSYSLPPPPSARSPRGNMHLTKEEIHAKYLHKPNT